MTTQEIYRVNDREVVTQLVDDEVIAIHQEKGSYYSLRGCGPGIWGLIEKGASLDDIVRLYALPYQDEERDPNPEELIVAFCRKLHDEGLISVAHEDVAQTGQAANVETPLDARISFAPPIFEVFEDMKEYLLIDPVHKVDDTGWPNQKHEQR